VWIYYFYQEVFNSKKVKAGLSKEEDNRLRAKYSDLSKVILRCLSIEALTQHKVYEDDLILKELLQRKQYKLLQRRVNTSIKLLQKSEHLSMKYHKHYFVLEENVLMMNMLTGKELRKENLQGLNEHLDISYLIDKLKTQITLLTSQVFSANLYDFSSMDAIQNLLSLAPYKKHTTLKLYATAVELIKEETEKKYYQFLDLLAKLSDQLPKDEIESMYDVATNFCMKQIKIGNFDNENLFDLYQLMHSNNFLIRNNYINENILKNVITMSCRVQQFTWAEELIESCFPYLRTSIRVSVQNFNLGAVAFYQKQYDKAHHFFSKVQEINLNYDINNRVMLAKTFYETDKYYDLPTFTHFNSELRFFDRTKLLKSSTGKSYKNFFITLKNLYKIKHRVVSKSIEQLETKLNKMDNVATKDWLIEKIREMKVGN